MQLYRWQIVTNCISPRRLESQTPAPEYRKWGGGVLHTWKYTYMQTAAGACWSGGEPFPFYCKRQSDIIREEQGEPEISFPQEKLLRVLKTHLHANMPETGSKYRVQENGGLPPPPPVWRRFALAIMEISRSHEREVMRSEMRSFGIHV